MAHEETYIEGADSGGQSIEYGVTPLSYSPGRGPSRVGHIDSWDDGEPEEIEYPRFVELYVNGERRGVVPWSVMVLDAASLLKVPLETAEQVIQFEVRSRQSDALEEIYDGPEYDYEGE